MLYVFLFNIIVHRKVRGFAPLFQKGTLYEGTGTGDLQIRQVIHCQVEEKWDTTIGVCRSYCLNLIIWQEDIKTINTIVV